MKAQNLGWWRTALGENPSGVTVITSAGPDGSPVGMIVGTFTVVSEQPPLIGFMPVLTSRSWAAIAANGRFVASVLGADHEDVSRSFTTRLDERFTIGDWVKTDMGLLRLADAVAWFEGAIEARHPAGDHEIVVATVDDFGVGDGRNNLPLLYLRGGYGTFAIGTPGLDPHSFSDRLRLAEQMRDAVESLASRLGIECVLSTVAGDSVAVLTRSGVPARGSGATLRNTTFPFAAPLAPGLAAWASPELHRVWVENARHLLGAVDRPALAALLEQVRARGYAVSSGSAMAERFDKTVQDPTTSRAALAALWTDVNAELADLAQDPNWYRQVSGIQVPVMSPDGTAAMELVINGFEPFHECADFERVVHETQGTARHLTELVQHTT